MKLRSVLCFAALLPSCLSPHAGSEPTSGFVAGLVFTTSRTGEPSSPWNLYSLDRSTLERRDLGKATSFQLSPMHDRVLFDAPAGLSTTDLAGDDLAIMVAGNSLLLDHAWSTDGTRVLFVSNGRLESVHPDGSGVVVLSDDPGLGIFTREWAPRTNYLAYRDSVGTGYIVNEDGSATANIGPLQNRWWPSAPGWSSDGRHFVRISSGDSALHMHGIDRTDTLIARDGGDSARFLWSPDGSHLAYSTSSGIGLVSADGTTNVHLASGVASLLGAQLFWSPDGKQLAFIAPDGLWVAQVDGPAPARIEMSQGAMAAQWSLDGTQLAYTVSIPSGDCELRVIRSPGGPSTVVHAGHDPVGFEWSPSGDRLSYVAVGPGQESLGVVTADGSKDVPFPESDVNVGFGWSATGDALAVSLLTISSFESDIGSQRLFIWRGEGPAEGPLAQGQVWGRWTSDGSAFVYTDGGLLREIQANGQRRVLVRDGDEQIANFDLP